MLRSKQARRSRAAQISAGAAVLVVPAVPVSAVALAASVPDAGEPLQAVLEHRHLAYGQSLTVTGITSYSRGRTLELEYAPKGQSWRVISRALVHTNGRYRLFAPLHKSGAVRVAGAASAFNAATASASAAPSGGAASPTQGVEVAAKFGLRIGSLDGLAGQPMRVRGTLLPRSGGRVVKLEGRWRGRWHRLAAARTRSDGRFELRYTPADTGELALRARFPGDHENAAAATRPGRLTTYRESVASWYGDGGATSCGFHAEMGVANKDLPCGTQVKIRYAGRTVTAIVDDRGPFVGGRDWDLNQNVAAALGFDGVGTIWASR
jgi:rare lipoprotein A